MPDKHISLRIGEDDYHFLHTCAQLLSLSDQDALAAFWKIGAAAYAGNVMGYELPKTLLDFSPSALEPIFRQFLARHAARPPHD